MSHRNEGAGFDLELTYVPAGRRRRSAPWLGHGIDPIGGPTLTDGPACTSAKSVLSPLIGGLMRGRIEPSTTTLVQPENLRRPQLPNQGKLIHPTSTCLV